MRKYESFLATIGYDTTGFETSDGFMSTTEHAASYERKGHNYQQKLLDFRLRGFRDPGS